MIGRPPSPARLPTTNGRVYKARIWSPSSDQVRR